MTDDPFDSHRENYPTAMSHGDNALLHETIALREAHHRVACESAFSLEFAVNVHPATSGTREGTEPMPA